MRTEVSLYKYRLLPMLAVALFSACFPALLFANTLFELGINGGYTDNLVGDSSSLVDRYSTTTASVRFYPTSKTEFNVSGDAMFYDRNPGLSNRKIGIGAKFIPLNPESRLALFLSSDFDIRRYRADYDRYNNNNFNVRTSIGYRLSATARLRAGIQILGSEYLGSSSGDKTSAEAYLGFNTTLFGDNSIDCELGYGSMDYRFIDPGLEFIDFENPEGALVSGKLRSFYLSPRFSRPLGSQTGLNLTLSFRQFANDNDRIVYGSSVGLLSPWTSVWEGTSATLTVKSYLIPHCVTTIGTGYWNRRHLRTIENNMFPLVIGTDRDDEQVRSYCQVARPVLIGAGLLLQPYLSLEFSNNRSTNRLFEYTSFAISTGISLKL
ncbi:MAG: hypothetical protein IPH59_08415 [bacterium]|nr:hypothetical protein [bacterium]